MPFDVFLSHNSKDKPSVRNVAEALKQRGLRVWLDEWELRPGEPWQATLEREIENVQAAAVLVGKDGVGPWEEPEVRAFLSESVNRAIPVIPVLLPGAPSRVELPIFLKQFTWVDLRDGLTDEGLDRLTWGITGRKPHAEPHDEAPETTREPRYRTELVRLTLDEVFTTVGLPKFTYVEPDVYPKVAQAIKTHGSHLVIEGPSGVGKTCIVFRILGEMGLKNGKDYFYRAARNPATRDGIVDELDNALENPRNSTIILDDFHILEDETQQLVAERLKALSDQIFLGDLFTKVVLIGIPASAAGLLNDTSDLGARVSICKLGDATDRQLSKLIAEGEERLGIRIFGSEELVEESNGSFHLCQMLCHDVCFNERILDTQDEETPIRFRLEEIRSNVIEQLSDRYGDRIFTFCKQETKEFKYLTFIVSLSLTTNSVMHLPEIEDKAGPLSTKLQGIADELPKVLGGPTGSGLGRYIYFDRNVERVSIEDPSFSYYLKHFNVEKLMNALGCKDEEIRGFFLEGKWLLDEDTSTPKSVTTIPDNERDLVFISYSHKDSEWMERLSTHLKPFVRHGALSAWTDTQIKAGSRWRDEIERALSGARVAILLVSPNFLASDFIADNELPTLLKRAQKDGLKIVWIAVSPSAYELSGIDQYQSANNPERPLALLSEAEQDAVLVEVGRAVQRLLRDQ